MLKHYKSDGVTVTFPTSLLQVEALRLWQSTEGSDMLASQLPSTRSGSLASLQYGRYGNVVCQVVACCVLKPNVSVLLKVWDGTKIAQSVSLFLRSLLPV